jgi:hypothetical protein
VKRGRPPKLTAEAVREIRAWLKAWRAMPRPAEVARKHGLYQGRVYKIGDGHEYKWVK